MKYFKQKTIETKVNGIPIVKRLGFDEVTKQEYDDSAKSYNLGNYDGTEQVKNELDQMETIQKADLFVGADNEVIGENTSWQ